MTWIQNLTSRAATLLLAALLTGTIHAEEVPIINGTLWMGSSTIEKKSYLVGASNLLAAEYAFQKQAKIPPTDEQTMIGSFYEHMDRATLDESIKRIDQWYRAHPNDMGISVLAVIWIDMVEPNL